MTENTERLDAIRHDLLTLPALRDWPEIEGLVRRPTRPKSRHLWDLVDDARRAVRGPAEHLQPISGALFALMYAIHLVDDLVDEDPDGWQHRSSVGATANCAAALQGAAAELIARSSLPPATQALIQGRLARAATETALGQHLDGLDRDSEDEYWRVVRLKTPPLFRCALACGALGAGGSVEQADALEALGDDIGEIVQISDDLGDAMARPAAPDWQRRATNLPILFARVAEHPERETFDTLRTQASDPEVLEQLQAMLLRSGAVSYCAYRLVEVERRVATRPFDGLDLDGDVLREVVADYLRPVHALLQSVGFDPALRAARG
ncbi:MAG: polyprenyl synthetase family protein [Acidobacteriota bacterium]